MIVVFWMQRNDHSTHIEHARKNTFEGNEWQWTWRYYGCLCVCALSENGSVQWSFVDAANGKFDTNFIRIYFCRIWKVIQCAIAHKNSLKFKSRLINWLSKRTIVPTKCNYIAENAKNNGDKEQQMHSKPSIEILLFIRSISDNSKRLEMNVKKI